MHFVTAPTDHGVGTQQAAMHGGFLRSKDDVYRLSAPAPLVVGLADATVKRGS